MSRSEGQPGTGLNRSMSQREDAYRFVQRNAMEVWKQGGDFASRLKKDPDIRKLLSDREVDACFDLSHTLKNVDYIFRRVFGKRK